MQAELNFIIPEIVLLAAISIILLMDVFVKQKTKSLTYFLSQVALILTFAMCLPLHTESAKTIFANHMVIDSLSQGLKLLILGVVFVVLIYSRVYVKERDMARSEFHLLVLFSTLGMMLLVSANSLMLLYLGLELFTLPVYILVALRREDAACVEAGMKYFVVGALASGLLLYGISMLFGFSQSIELSQVAQAIQSAKPEQMGFVMFAMTFIIIGIAFKLGAVPCHMWIPDIYEGAPTNVTLLIGSAHKLAAFGMVYRVLNDMFIDLAAQWTVILMVLAVLSLAIGNIVAIAQSNIKRMLAYSTIAHIGFILFGFNVAPSVGFAPALYYTVSYVIMAACAFGVITLISAKGQELDKLEDLKGLSQRNPWIAFIMLLVMFSFVGIPPTLGFYAKFVVLKAVVDSGFLWLAIIGVVFSIIGAFYYLRVVWLMYFEKPVIPNSVGGVLDFRAVLSLNGLLVLALGIVPAPLFDFCAKILLPAL